LPKKLYECNLLKTRLNKITILQLTLLLKLDRI